MWNLYYNEKDGLLEIYDENKNIIAVTSQRNINKFNMFNLSLILNSKKLYKIVDSIKNIHDNDMQKIKQEASLLIDRINDLSNIKINNRSKEKFPVAYIDVNTDKLIYNKTSKLSDFIFFDEIFNSKGFLSFNVETDSLDTSFRVLNRFVFSSSVAESIILKLSEKYNFIANFISEFEKSNLNSLFDFTYNVIDELIGSDYEKEMTLYEYLSTYPLLDDNNGIFNIKYTPAALNDCMYSIHSLLKIQYGCNEEADGMLFYNKKNNKYYVYDLYNKELIFTTIGSDNTSLKEVIVKFTDFIQA